MPSTTITTVKIKGLVFGTSTAEQRLATRQSWNGWDIFLHVLQTCKLGKHAAGSIVDALVALNESAHQRPLAALG